MSSNGNPTAAGATIYNNGTTVYSNGTIVYSNNTYSFGPSMVITATISTVVLGLLFLLYTLRCIYARFSRRRNFTRNRRQSRQLIISIRAPQFPSHDAPKTGLDSAVIAALPTFVYKKPGQIDGTATTECSICLSIIEEEEVVRLLPNCSHFFHSQCIDMWLNSHSTCPICRTVAEPQAPPVPEQEPEAQSHGTGDEVPPTVPPLNSVTTGSEDASYETAQSSKVDASSSRPSSFQNILSWNGSGRRIQPFELSSVGVEDPEAMRHTIPFSSIS